MECKLYLFFQISVIDHYWNGFKCGYSGPTRWSENHQGHLQHSPPRLHLFFYQPTMCTFVRQETCRSGCRVAHHFSPMTYGNKQKMISSTWDRLFDDIQNVTCKGFLCLTELPWGSNVSFLLTDCLAYVLFLYIVCIKHYPICCR